MFNIGPQELLLILLVALVIVGPKRLPELSRTIGRGLREFRKAQDEVTKTIRLGLDETEPTAGRAAAARPSTSPSDETADVAPTAAEQAAPQDDAADIARTLGRGLAEIRRARQEIQRSFRVDLSDRPTGSRSKAAGSTPAPAPATTAPAGPEPAGPAPAVAGPVEPEVPSADTEPAVPGDPAPEPATEPSDGGSAG